MSKVFLMSINKSQRNWTLILGQNDLRSRTIILGQREYLVSRENNSPVGMSHHNLRMQGDHLVDDNHCATLNCLRSGKWLPIDYSPQLKSLTSYKHAYKCSRGLLHCICGDKLEPCGRRILHFCDDVVPFFW